MYSRETRKDYLTNETDVFYIDGIWSLDMLDLNDYGPENNRGYRYALVIIGNFSKFGFTIPFKNKISQTITNSFENSLITSKRKPNLIESDRDEEFYNNKFQNFLIINNIKHYSLGAVFLERFNRTFKDLLKRLVFEKGDSNWIRILPGRTKQYKKRVHSSTKLTPIQAGLKKNEGFNYQNFLDKRKKNKSKISSKRSC